MTIVLNWSLFVSAKALGGDGGNGGAVGKDQTEDPVDAA
tara:strand:- start:418 stop:534 length:117 start_codon:yes stop_codon:yes gene_type:complete